jgi:hypothetical protein
MSLTLGEEAQDLDAVRGAQGTQHPLEILARRAPVKLQDAPDRSAVGHSAPLLYAG